MAHLRNASGFETHSVYKISAMHSIPDLTQENKTQGENISALPIRELLFFEELSADPHFEGIGLVPSKTRLKEILHHPKYSLIANNMQGLGIKSKVKGS